MFRDIRTTGAYLGKDSVSRNIYKRRRVFACMESEYSTPHHLANPIISEMVMVESRISTLSQGVKSLYYAVLLFQRECPKCGGSSLFMADHGICECRSCTYRFDATITFQTCNGCDSRLIRKTYHYWCPKCRHPVKSRYCLDVRVFNTGYFRDMMRESRERKREKIEKMRKLLANSRSRSFVPEIDPLEVNGLDLMAELDEYVNAPVEVKKFYETQRPDFDLIRYRNHIIELVTGCIVRFEGVSPLIRDRALDRIYRFIAVIFMEQNRDIRLEQDYDGTITLLGNEVVAEG